MDNAPQVVEEILTVLAEKFGTSVAHLWEVMVYQVYVDAFAVLGELVVVLIFGALALGCVWKCTQDDVEKYVNPMDSTGAWIRVLTAGFLGVILFIITAATVNKFAALLNPEYVALQQILNLVR